MEGTSVGNYLRGRGLVATEGEVADEERPRRASRHGAAVLEHDVEGDGEGGVVAVDDHGGGVADEADVDPRGVDVDGGGVVVGGHDRDGLPAAVLTAEGRHRHSPCRRRLLRPRAPIDGRLRHVAQHPPRQAPEGVPRRHLAKRRRSSVVGWCDTRATGFFGY